MATDHDLRWPTYRPTGITLEAAADDDPRGSLYVRDAGGRRFLDAVTGIGCAVLGHAHPRWVRAVAEQAARLASASGTYATAPREALARALADRFPVPDARVFFANTGTEATEAAVKLALRATGRTVVVAFEGGFHGRTLGALGLTATPAYRAPYLHCLDEPPRAAFADVRVLHLPFDDVPALEAAFAEHGDEIALVAVEPVQGEAGIRPASRPFLVAARRLTEAHGALLGLDEVQCGMGRTGAWSAWTTLVGEGAGAPDLVWLAKALGGGFPIGACLARADLAAAMTPGTHGSTFGGNPLACAAALATIEVIEDEGLLAAAAAQTPTLREIAAARPIAAVRQIRGAGAMIGIELSADAKAVAAAMRERGVLVTVCHGTTVRLLLPYRAGRSELETIWSALAEACADASAAS